MTGKCISRRQKRLVLRSWRGNMPLRSAISGYRSMWLIVAFDLPVGTRTERRHATQFRKNLLDEGFFMKQWSIYLRYFISRAQAEAAADRIGNKVPQMGSVSVLFLTDRQYGMTRNFFGKAPLEAEKKPDQLALF